MAYYNGKQLIGFKAISGYEDGRQDEWNEFWDAFQINGAKTNYSNAFYNEGWNDINFNPKYPMQPTRANTMFRDCAISSNLPSRAKEILKSIDFSKCTDMNFCFNGATLINELGIIDLSSLNGTAQYLFYANHNLKSIEKIIVHKNISFGSGNFDYCGELENVIFEGEIINKLAFPRSSKLNNQSIQSIIDCLMDLTGSTSQTLTFHSTVGGKLTDTQKATITAKNWTLVY